MLECWLCPSNNVKWMAFICNPIDGIFFSLWSDRCLMGSVKLEARVSRNQLGISRPLLLASPGEGGGPNWSSFRATVLFIATGEKWKCTLGNRKLPPFLDVMPAFFAPHRPSECSNKTHFPSLNFRQTGSETWKWAGHLFNIWSHQPPIVRKVKICRNYVWLERAGGAATHFKLQHLDAKGTMNSNECKFANFLGVWQSFYLLFTNKTWLKTRREINHLFRRGQYIYIVTFQMYIHVVTNCG